VHWQFRRDPPTGPRVYPAELGVCLIELPPWIPLSCLPSQFLGDALAAGVAVNDILIAMQ